VIAETANPIMGFLPWLVILGLIYFLMIRPQQKRDQERQQMLEELTVGYEVVTIGGIHGTIKALREEELTLEVADNILLTMNKNAIAGLQSEYNEQEEGGEGTDG